MIAQVFARCSENIAAGTKRIDRSRPSKERPTIPLKDRQMGFMLQSGVNHLGKKDEDHVTVAETSEYGVPVCSLKPIHI